MLFLCEAITDSTNMKQQLSPFCLRCDLLRVLPVGLTAQGAECEQMGYAGTYVLRALKKTD